jgi:N-methylhydantoinase A/oxoprolinase/acetone carboxylase beta subunit
LVGERPVPLRKIAVSSGAQRALASLKRKGLVQLAGFTPSDAAHVLDLQANWSRPAALVAARLLARFRDMRFPDDARVTAFCRGVWSETVRLTCRVIAEMALGRSFGDDAILEAVCSGRGELGLARLRISPSIPVVAVGGPVKVYYGEAARRLDCEMIFPPYFDVANAVGAATGVVARTVTVSIEGDGAACSSARSQGRERLHRRRRGSGRRRGRGAAGGAGGGFGHGRRGAAIAGERRKTPSARRAGR